MKEIQNIITNFYSTLYRTSELSRERIKHYLQTKPQMRINEDHKIILEAPFTDIKIKEAIRKQKKKRKLLALMEYYQNIIIK